MLSRMTDPDLVALSDAGFHAFDREVILRSGGEVTEERGLLQVAGTHPAPFIVNGTMRIDPSISADETIARARKYSTRLGRQASITTHGDDTDLEEALSDAGWELVVRLAGMVALDPVATVEPGAGVELIHVRTDAERLQLIDVLAEAFGPDEPWPGIWKSVFSDMSTIGPDVTAVLAPVNGEVAAAAVGYALEPAGVVGMVGTIGRFGRRGLGELVTRAVASASQQPGDRPVVLQSSPMARPLYERIGFRAVTTYSIWVDAAPT